ncbi:MAG TPA: hypothetical protein VJQ56_03565 [Blastocatellia bacterium]|nr:hypothetical protein [Blastocatellia bacterium]
MKHAAILFCLIIISLTAASTAFGQKGCQLEIIGTWKVEGREGTPPLFYRFAPDSTVTVLSGAGAEMKEITRATYALDNPKAPKSIVFKAAAAGGGLDQGTTTMQITGHDDTSFTCSKTGYEPTRWVKVDPYRYFIVLAGRSGTFYDRSGPTFPMLIKMDNRETQVDAFGIFAAQGIPHFGPVPPAIYNEFMKEPAKPSDVMLRLEITGAQYERGLKIVRTWERRLREGALLYPDISMDNILLVKQVTESLNQCGERVKLYNLDWGIDDKISDGNKPPIIPFLYFKELRRLNESMHVRDEKFNARREQQAGM